MSGVLSRSAHVQAPLVLLVVAGRSTDQIAGLVISVERLIVVVAALLVDLVVVQQRLAQLELSGVELELVLLLNVVQDRLLFGNLVVHATLAAHFLVLLDRCTGALLLHRAERAREAARRCGC